MDGRTHSKYFTRSLILFIPLLIYLGQWMFIPLLFLSNSIVDSDEDNKWRGGGSHRNILTHSLIWPFCISLVLWLPIYNVPNVAFTRYFLVLIPPVIIHLFLDLFTPRTDENGKSHWSMPADIGGKYRIRLYKGRRLSVRATRLWLAANIIVGVAFILLFL